MQPVALVLSWHILRLTVAKSVDSTAARRWSTSPGSASAPAILQRHLWKLIFAAGMDGAILTWCSVSTIVLTICLPEQISSLH